MLRKYLFTHGSDDDEEEDHEHGAAGGYDYRDVVFDNDDDDTYEQCDSNDLPKDDDDEDKEMQLIHKNIQTDRMLDLIIKNTNCQPTNRNPHSCSTSTHA